MLTDKEVKKEFRKKASASPDKYYATGVLKEEGFIRKKCKCGKWFWTVNEGQTQCGEPECVGGFRFFDDNPAKNKLDYVGVWKEFAKFFKKRGYTPIDRYPVVARWRDDTDFVQASIYDFQPYVVSGEVEPPANPLVVPQFCLRFNDIDNVGITGAHYTGFVMIGQHAFTAPKDFDQPKYFRDIHGWLVKGLGLPKKEITYHEDVWVGGGNFGPCMEYFSRGLELGNQVYMLYEKTPKGHKELNIKVLDMGMGHERNSWFTKGTSTSYETTFPTVCKKLYSITGIKPDSSLIKRFLPYSSYLNVDEVEDINKTWKFVADKVGEDVKTLREQILPLAGLYSVGEHTRSLLVALNDGALPSNVGGGYNLRVLLRRALSFINEYGWKIELPKIAEMHAEYLKGLFPELRQNLGQVSQILEHERQKYEATKQKTKQIISRLKNKEIDEKGLLTLYDSNGIDPQLIATEAKNIGKIVKVPDNFYAKVAELHEQREQEHATKKEEELDLKGVPETKADYFDDYEKHSFKAKVLKIIDVNNKNNVILDYTLFYPTSGGQLHDMGRLGKNSVETVFKQGSVIVHVLDGKADFKEGDSVDGVIEQLRRQQLAKHHTATHIVNAAAKKVLGNHINQAGAKKDIDKAHLDITHYKPITDEEMTKIEKEANNIVKKGIKINMNFMPRKDAEKKYGVNIYQGGVVPGKELRIVDIEGTDVEACGGTHCKNTSEVGEIKLIKSTKIQDGIVRITFVAGEAKDEIKEKKSGLLGEITELLDCNANQVPGRAEELFKKWKKARKAYKKKKINELEDDAFELTSIDETNISKEEILSYTSKILQTQPENLANTIKKFRNNLKEWK